jgi:mannosylglycerate hydrolase
VDDEDTGTLALTLFRSVGAMGKPDLQYRPGRLSGMPMPTPDSQIPGRLEFRFAIRLFRGEVAPLASEARRFLAPAQAYHVNEFNKFSLNSGPRDLAARYSMMSMDSPMVVSAIKRAEDDDALVLRMFNPFDRAVELGQIAPGDLQIATLHHSDMNEHKGMPIKSEETITAQPQQAVTLILRTKPR